MPVPSRKRIFARSAASVFVGRAAEIERLTGLVNGSLQLNGLLMPAVPGAGASELLRQVYDRSFYENNGTVPFYFAFRKDESDGDAARRFVHQFILQSVAFSRRDPYIIGMSAGLAELSELAMPKDGPWIDRLVETCGREYSSNHDGSYLRNCLSAPVRAESNGVRVAAFIDDVHNAAHGSRILADLCEIFAASENRYVLSGRRRYFADASDLPSLNIDVLPFSASGALIEGLARQSHIPINEASRDLISIQLQGNPTVIEHFFRSAADLGTQLESFENVEKAYSDSLYNGNIRKFFDAKISAAFPLNFDIRAALSLLNDSAEARPDGLSLESWRRGLGLDDEAFYGAMNNLHISEILDIDSNAVVTPNNIVLTDYIGTRFRLDVAGENAALNYGRTLGGFIARAPEIMARFYRTNAAIGLRDVLSLFRSQVVPAALLDYALFKDEYKGAPDIEILRDIRSADETIELPKVFFVADAADFYAPLEMITERVRSAVALGRDRAENETVWIAAEVDSKLEASKEAAEFWSDRLEMAALMCDLRNYRIWLVAPEGFSDEALGVLRQRNGYGSNRKQFELLKEFIGVPEGAQIAREYEVVLPMGEDAELIAANAAEDIAKRHNFDSHSINQIKTAIVEACINASEHSLSPDGKIYQKFTVDQEKMVITISNRGLKLSGMTAPEPEAGGSRRGWGLTLMRRLMDEVNIEQVDDGTRISMTKYLKVE